MDNTRTTATETEEMQAQACYDVAMERIKAQHPEINPDTYSDRVWFSVLGMVVNSGYDVAMEYAREAEVHI